MAKSYNIYVDNSNLGMGGGLFIQPQPLVQGWWGCKKLKRGNMCVYKRVFLCILSHTDVRVDFIMYKRQIKMVPTLIYKHITGLSNLIIIISFE